MITSISWNGLSQHMLRRTHGLDVRRLYLPNIAKMTTCFGDVAQMVERPLRMRKVVGSMPTVSISIFAVAQVALKTSVLFCVYNLRTWLAVGNWLYCL